MSNSLLKGRKNLVCSVVAGLMMAGWSLSSQAQECTIDNWQGGAVGADLLTAATPAAGNSRYAGPCSLAVELDAEVAFVVDDLPADEQQYVLRFYFNPNGNASADLPMIIYAANSAADGTGDDALQLWYNVASADPFVAQPNHITLVIETEDGPAVIEAGATGVRSNGWNSFEIVWSAGAEADVVLNVNGQADLVAEGLDTSSQRVNSALLGLVGFPEGASIASGTPLYFDDFDSRRQSRPGRLCRGLTDESRDELTIADALAIVAEFGSGSATLAGGQPDFNEDGAVNLADFFAVVERFATGNGACELNR